MIKIYNCKTVIVKNVNRLMILNSSFRSWKELVDLHRVWNDDSTRIIRIDGIEFEESENYDKDYVRYVSAIVHKKFIDGYITPWIDES